MHYRTQSLLLLTTLGLTLSPLVVAQTTPSDLGLTEIKIQHGGHTVTFEVSVDPALNPTRKPLLIFIQGSSPRPILQPGTQDGVVVIKSLLMVQPAWVRDRYHFVVVLKRGVPFYGPQDYIPNEEYYNWSSLSNLTEDVNAVIAELSTKTWVDSSRIVVIGHSAGADVAAKVAATNSKVTHVVCLGAGGASQIYDSIVGIRKKVLTGDLTTSQGEDLIQKEYATFREIFADPDSTSKKWQGETYKEWHSFLAESTTENLLKAHVPVFVAVGTKDRQVPIESADISAVEFLRRGKSNLTFVDLPDAGHSMMAWQTEPNGKGRLIDFQERIVREALRWVDDPTKWHSPSDFYRAY